MRLPKIGALAFGVCALPGWAPAQQIDVFDCVFDAECFETDACTEAGYDMTLSLTMIGDQQVAVAVTQNETLTGGGFGFDNDTQTFLFKSDIGPVMVSLSADGAARQSIHSVSEAMMINYSGQCEARE